MFESGFVAVAEPSPLDTRKAAREAVYSRQSEAFKAAYAAFVLEWLRIHGEASNEPIRAAYARDRWRPQPNAWQSAGGVFVRLIRSGEIREVGKERSKKFGNDLSVYELIK